MEEITPQFKHNWFGTFMFKRCARATKFLIKHKWLYYLLACSWGAIMTLLGLIITLGLTATKLFNKKIHFARYNWIYNISVGPDYWGGFEMGLMFVRDQKSWTSLDAHEFGHTFQNCILGPLFPCLVGIPSAIRYWIIEINNRRGRETGSYDAIWFEDAASQCGEYANRYLNKKETN